MTAASPAAAEARSARRAERRRAEILDAALRVFESVGFEAATTRDIAREADVSEGTIYNYFPDKGELYIRALEAGSGLANLVDEVGRADAPFEELLRRLGEWRAAHLPRQSALIELWAQIMARPSLRERYRSVIWEPAAQAFETALARAEQAGQSLAAPPRLAARILMSTMLGLMLMGLADDELHDLIAGEDGAVDVRSILWRGLADGELGARAKRRRR